jgi:hypothetical protein
MVDSRAAAERFVAAFFFSYTPEKMRFVLLAALSAGLVTSASAVRAQQAATPSQFFLGRLSDSMCAGSHQVKSAALKMTERECIFACINALAKYVLVDADGKVMPIANQDVMGLPLYAGRPVRLTGELKDGAIFVTRVEAIPAHLHIGHVVTNWRDTPGTRGFLPVAADEARVATTHAKLAAKGATLDDMKLHAGHVLNALDPGAEPNGPGAKYGVKKATAGAIQHLEFASKAEGVTANITTQAAAVAMALNEVSRSTDEAIAVAQKVRAASDQATGSTLVAELDALTTQIASGLQQAQTHMGQMVKGEGLEGAPR